MMKKLIVISSFIILTACRDGNECSFDKLASYGEIEDHVTLRLHDMQYACGDCVSLYRVDKIIHSENNEYKFYFNKEITISFLSDNLEKKLEDELNKSSCDHGKYSYILSGGFRNNLLGVGRLDVTEGHLVCDD
ncbi:hypothetical protein FNI18_22970 [Salmonella enterica subsp. salamae]|nr:hypothetical protein [Salmonella enterica subsp. salamae]